VGRRHRYFVVVGRHVALLLLLLRGRAGGGELGGEKGRLTHQLAAVAR
jgi:hypothetical protein